MTTRHGSRDSLPRSGWLTTRSIVRRCSRRSEAVEKPAKGERGLSKGAQCATFLPTHRNLVGGDHNEHYAILSNGFDRGAMDLALGAAPSAEMASRWPWASAV